ncbi:hypothetical protein T4D_4382 [Trichinella pseudospiralis]|uniref:Uncharacterized protein n=1 Tax=Trichinella pseudospiralis TaxID=6337 RepID=A0A0V1FHY9_TRIPS|nr:hypothetical protein T4D_4382 [Trichinella pseudospiralis]
MLSEIKQCKHTDTKRKFAFEVLFEDFNKITIIIDQLIVIETAKTNNCIIFLCNCFGQNILVSAEKL